MVKLIITTSVVVWAVSGGWWSWASSRQDPEVWVLATALANWFVVACSVGWYQWWRDVQDD